MYIYLPTSFSADLAQCDVPPFSTSNPTYGTSIGRGSILNDSSFNLVIGSRSAAGMPQRRGSIKLRVRSHCEMVSARYTSLGLSCVRAKLGVSVVCRYRHSSAVHFYFVFISVYRAHRAQLNKPELYV